MASYDKYARRSSGLLLMPVGHSVLCKHLAVRSRGAPLTVAALYGVCPARYSGCKGSLAHRFTADTPRRYAVQCVSLLQQHAQGYIPLHLRNLFAVHVALRGYVTPVQSFPQCWTQSFCLLWCGEFCRTPVRQTNLDYDANNGPKWHPAYDKNI